MTAAELRLALGRLRTLAPVPREELVPDRSLLERFLDDRDQTAFEELVRRHGPMVLAVCRRVLRQEQDAEDAFQATFLVLASRAETIRSQQSVAPWLSRVAYHAALRLRAGAERLRAREQEIEEMENKGALDMTFRELREVLLEELQALPEHYRAPLVLCYLEGRTHQEAARHLGCGRDTLRGRLNRGRERLRQRLARRGVTVPAAMAAAGLVESSSGASIPGSLLNQAVATAMLAATGRPTGGKVAALAEKVIQTMFLTRMKPLACALMLATAVAGLLTCAALAGRPKVVGSDRGAAPAADRSAKEEPRIITGRVDGPDGKPADGARVAVLGVELRPHRGRIGEEHHEVLVEARADKSGQFRLELPRDKARKSWSLQALASAPGFGVGWQDLRLEVEQPAVVIRLTEQQVIRGRLIDLKGDPVKGAPLHVKRISSLAPGAGGRSPCPMSESGFPGGVGRLPGWPAGVKTDEQGRFVVRGLGKGLSVALLVTAETAARQQIIVQTTALGKPEAVERSLDAPRMLEGTVAGEKSDKPVGKVFLTVFGTGDEKISGWSDEKGKFRIACPPGRLSLRAWPADRTEWLGRVQSVDYPRGKVRHEVKVTLPRGVRVKGKVTEMTSSKPVTGALVMYHPFGNNPNRDAGVWSWITFPGEYVRTRADGSFEATVLPGEGHLLVKGPTRDYLLERLDVGQLWTGKPGGAPLYVHAAKRLDLKTGQPPHELKLSLRRGVTIRAKVLDPAGKPVKQAVLYSPLYPRDQGDIAWSDSYLLPELPIRGGQLILPGCDPRATRTVFLLDRANRQGAVVKLMAGKDTQPAIRLAPCGTAQQRYVDEKGKPFPGLGAALQLVLEEKSPWSVLPAADGYSGKDGVLSFPLIPGATYRYHDDKGKHEFVAQSGKETRLPDIVVKLRRK